MRTDTGTCATSGVSGRSSCSISQRRTAPAQTETTTSLTVAPCVFLAALKSARGIWPKTKRRCGETRPLKSVFGAVRSGRSTPSRRSRPPSLPSVLAPGKIPNGVSSMFGIAFGSARSIRTG